MMLSDEPNVIKLASNYTLFQQVWDIYQFGCIGEENELDLSGRIIDSDSNDCYREFTFSRF